MSEFNTKVICQIKIAPLFNDCVSLLFVFDARPNEGRKEMLYLTMDSNTFYLLLYGIRHMVKDNSDSERGNLSTTWATLSD